MLEITKGQKVKLPKKYHETNNMLAYLYDLLTEIFSDEYYSKLKVTEIPFNGDEDLRIAFSERNQHALDNLKSHGKNAELTEILTKNIILGVLSDMLNFIYEAISIAKKGKMSVAYALLRKPFTDELLILEQLLINKEDFIKKFFHEGNAKGYDPSCKTLNKLDIITSSMSSLNLDIMYNADLIYKLRYDKGVSGGINGITNQALHIVTTDPNYRTANQNLNFIFSSPDNTEQQWEHFYFAVPLLLMYTSAVADKIIFQYIDDGENRFIFKNLKRLLAYINIYTKSKPTYNRKFYNQLGKCLISECRTCKNINKFIRADFDLFFRQGIFLCSKCFRLITFNSDDLKNLKNIMFP